MRVYNTLTKKIEDFIPFEDGVVRMYTCGPTVYNYAHIGNLRTYIFEDILERSLNYIGYKVYRVMNITDVGHLTSDGDTGEDKMAKGALREGKTVRETAKIFNVSKSTIHKDLSIRLKEIDNEYLTSYVNMRKYPTILFVMAKIMEMNNVEQNQVAMFLFNSIN